MKPSQQLVKAVESRLSMKSTRQEIERVLALERKGRLIDAEEQWARKEARAKALSQYDKQVAPYMISRMLEAKGAGSASLSGRGGNDAPRKLRGPEAVQGPTADFVGIAFLERAQHAARTVARVAAGGTGLASGFMVSDRLFLTNNHVIRSADAARGLVIEFDYELDAVDQPRKVTRYALDPTAFFATSPEPELDFTLVAVGQRINGQAELADIGYCPLLSGDDKHMLGEWVNIIQHPDGDFKQLVIRENLLVNRMDVVLHYKADTLPGSSGSPVFNDQWEAIALHHYGEPYRQKGVKYDSNLNEGIRISSIVKGLAQGALPVSMGSRELLHPIIGARRGDGRGRSAAPIEVRDPGKGLRIESDGTVTWQLPLELSVRIPLLAAASRSTPGPLLDAAPGPALVAGAEAVVIDTRYGNRSGYKPDFLGRNVPLPVLSAGNRKLAARPKGEPASAAPIVLKYEHFSIVLNAERRMPFFAAVNISGKRWKSVDRDSGLPRGESAEATETWYPDPRVNDDALCQQPLYDGQSRLAAERFDRGHMVRREYPNWGTDAQITRANADTFHFSNCCPQAGVFNQRAAHWQGIENYVINSASNEKVDVSVFIGPVFGKKDPKWKDVRVPMKFWKVLVRKVDGKLRAFGFMADQTKLAKAVLKAKEAAQVFDDMSKVDQYQVKISAIEKLTGLDFGDLKKADALKGSAESAAHREITHFAQLRI
jgi:endonuclease G